MSEFIHKEFPKSCEPEDFWGQVKRTVNGKPIGQDQIDMMVAAISKGLLIEKSDTILDIGCGNGALSHLFFDRISGLIGIDFSEFLVDVAKKHFEKQPKFTFHLGDALEFVRTLEVKERISKALCYGVFSYFDLEKSQQLLQILNTQYPHLSRVYIGNLPDRDRADAFYYKEINYSNLLDDHLSSIGIWRSKETFSSLANSCGWNIEFYQMPTSFYAGHYRYDVILTKP